LGDTERPGPLLKRCSLKKALDLLKVFDLCAPLHIYSMLENILPEKGRHWTIRIGLSVSWVFNAKLLGIGP